MAKSRSKILISNSYNDKHFTNRVKFCSKCWRFYWFDKYWNSTLSFKEFELRWKLYNNALSRIL